MATGTASDPEDDGPSRAANDAAPGPPRLDVGRGGGARLPVLSAIADPVLEAQVVAALAGPRSRLAVVRRCVDLPDLLAAAAAGTARAALVSADLRRLDQDALARLRRLGLAVVGLNDDAAPAAERAEVRLRQLGVDQVVAVSSSAAASADGLAVRLAEAAEAAVAAQAAPTAGRSQPSADHRLGHSAGGAPRDPEVAGEEADDLRPGGAAAGRVVAVWGPTGAPGRSFLSWHIAGALATDGRRVLLVDADTYGGSVSQYAGVVDEAPGLVAACRAANAGALDAVRFADAAVTLPVGDGGGNLALLTGIPRAHRWPEIRPAALERVLEVARLLADVVVVDCGFALEEDEELSYDTLAPQRNGATLAVLAAADAVLAVGTADAVGLTRLIAGTADLRDVLDARGADPALHVVVNRVRSGGRYRRQVIDALERHAGITPATLVPLDTAEADRALDEARPIREVAPRTPLAAAVDAVAAIVLPGAGVKAGSAATRRWGRRR